MPAGIGLPEIAIVLIIVLVIFGPKRLPDLGRSLGRGMREFKDSVTGKDKDELPSGEAVTKTTETTTVTKTEASDSEQPAPVDPPPAAATREQRP